MRLHPPAATTAFLTGRTCLVVGGAQGIGWAIAVAMAACGGDIHVCDNNQANLETARKELLALPWSDRVTLTQCDATRQEDLRAWIEGVYQRSSRLDVLVNNAAFTRWEPVDVMTTAEAELTMVTGFHATMYATKTALPLMRSTGSGHIVNMGSSTGRIFVEGPSAAYAASKAAVEAYTTILSLELRGTPIHTTLVRPGTVAGTNFFRQHVPRQRLPRAADFMPPTTPPAVARQVIRALRDHRPTVDIPRYLPALYLAHFLFPRAFRAGMRIGGSARRDYGNIPWTHQLNESDR